MLAERNCAHCGNPFSPTRKDNKYCSQNCGQKAFHKKREALGATDIQPEETKVMSLKRELIPPTPLDATAQFIIDILKGDKGDLKETVKEQAQKIEKLTEEKTSLEKQLESVTRDLSEKPKGLSGVFQSNPNMLKESLQEVPAILHGLIDVMKEWRAKQTPQIAGAPDSNQVHPLLSWLATLPEDLQVEVITMLENLKAISNPKLLLDTIAYINRSMMNTSKRAM